MQRLSKVFLCLGFSLDVSLSAIAQAKNNIILKGYNAEVYGTDAHTLAMKLCSAAYNAP